jgi:hypothetical protein
MEPELVIIGPKSRMIIVELVELFEKRSTQTTILADLDTPGNVAVNAGAEVEKQFIDRCILGAASRLVKEVTGRADDSTSTG